MSDSRDEVWYQIERHTQVAGSQSSKQLRGTWGCVHPATRADNDQFALKQANNLFASLKRHTRRPLNPRQRPRKNSAKIKIRVPIKKVPTQESDDASGKRPTKAKVLVVHRIGSSALTASA